MNPSKRLSQNSMPQATRPRPENGAAGLVTGPNTAAARVDSPRLSVPIRYLVVAAVILGAFLFAYWPTLRELVAVWDKEPDYSHGYLVIPLAAAFLYLRRASMPEVRPGFYWGGLVLIVASIALRIAGRALFLSPVDGWSIVFWAAGATWLLLGRRMLWWAAPAIGFLFFMVPLPFRMETWLSVPLQKIATRLSCWTLQLLGLPALYEGNIIFLGEHRLFVEEACSGMRIFIGILALAYAYLVLVPRAWWEKLLLVASVLPVAIVANVTRIVVTALLYQWASSEAARHFSHDWAGFIMIPYAAALFGFVLWYIGRLFPKVEHLGLGTVMNEK